MKHITWIKLDYMDDIVCMVKNSLHMTLKLDDIVFMYEIHHIVVIDHENAIQPY